MYINIYEQLIIDLKNKWGKNVENYVFRISMQSDLAKVQQLGSSRLGLSKRLWDKLDNYPASVFPKYPVLHEEMIIASHWQDLEDDVLVDNGTLKHKLHIYEEPFFTIYHKNKLLEIGKEDSLGQNNQGTHFFFLEPPLECLDSLWQVKSSITDEKTHHYVEAIPLPSKNIK